MSKASSSKSLALKIREEHKNRSIHEMSKYFYQALKQEEVPS